LDEPSAGLDPQARLAVWDLVRALRDVGTTIVLTTHHMSEAESLADHVVVVDDGRAVASGTTSELLGEGTTVRLALAPGRGPDGRPSDAELARDLGARLGLADDVRTTATPGVLEVRGGTDVDPALLHAVTGWAAERDLLLASLTTGRRTLEDVFLELTGR